MVRSPLFYWGIPLATTAILVAIAFSVVEDQTVRLMLLFIAALELVVTPQILKRAE
ncbi:hypothetical protein [Halapricum desulfuricans]|uniref:Putative membrane protein n=1 Tax=Halapricum desulfuricans TaxID=2841257 RepID=A0A897NAM1_9EURY|nr:hypothetical protein [Halapricum desulfuricans]QSG08405.1 putative membrane protein [Halapricum desulfuricans]